MKRTGDWVSAKQRAAAKAADEANESTKVVVRQCPAFGCPLAGALTTSTNGGGPWYCRHHFGRATTEFDAITTEILRGDPAAAPARSPLVQAMLDKLRTGAVPAR